jgi:hypothetical protein
VVFFVFALITGSRKNNIPQSLDNKKKFLGIVINQGFLGRVLYLKT